MYSVYCTMYSVHYMQCVHTVCGVLHSPYISYTVITVYILYTVCKTYISVNDVHSEFARSSSPRYSVRLVPGRFTNPGTPRSRNVHRYLGGQYM